MAKSSLLPQAPGLPLNFIFVVIFPTNTWQLRSWVVGSMSPWKGVNFGHLASLSEPPCFLEWFGGWRQHGGRRGGEKEIIAVHGDLTVPGFRSQEVIN